MILIQPFVGLLLASLASAVVAANETEIEKYLGDYRQKSFTSCFVGENNEMSRCDVENLLAIERKSADSFHVSFIVYGANFHVCEMSGDATVRAGKLEHRYFSENLSGGKLACVLTLELDEAGVILKADSNMSCKSWFCGQRAGFDGHRFYLREMEK